MAIDLSKYNSSQKSVDISPWKPPVPESTMKHRSAKVALSTRTYPEYLLSAYAIFEQEHGVIAGSLSELMHLIICEFVNISLENKTLTSLPDPAMAIETFATLGFMTAKNKENQSAISRILHYDSEKESNITSRPLSEQINYWKARDPEKAAELEELFLSQSMEELDGLNTDASTNPEKHKPDQSNIVDDNKSQDFAGKVNLEDVKTAED